jgi:phosphoribosylanthranilate isomerase
VKIFVKICGLTNTEAVNAAVMAGVDALGFVFANSPRQVSPVQAAALAAAAPAGITRVAVMRHPDPADWAAVQQIFQPDWLQTDAEDFERLEIDAAVRPLPVFRDHAGLEPDAVDWAQRVLFEGQESGHGLRVDWKHAADIARRCELILAGGLDPETVGDAIGQVRPWGVDVSSGVERSPGVKDPDKIAAFVEAVRQMEQAHAGGTD